MELSRQATAGVAIGIGAALAAGGVQAAPVLDPGKPQAVNQQHQKTYGQFAIWLDQDRVFISEAGTVRELPLGDTPQAQHLRQFLAGSSAESPKMLPDNMVNVGSGGSSIGWSVPHETKPAANPPPSAPLRSKANADQAVTPPATDKPAEPVAGPPPGNK